MSTHHPDFLHAQAVQQQRRAIEAAEHHRTLRRTRANRTRNPIRSGRALLPFLALEAGEVT